MRKVLSFVSACCVLAAITIVTVSPIEWRPGDVFGVDIDRALAFAVLGGLFTAAYPRRWRAIAGGVAVIACGLEAMQLLSESRHAQFSDAAVKMAGAFAGIALALVCRQVWFIRQARRNRRPAVSPATARISAVFFDPADGLLRLRFSNGEERLFAGVSEGAVTGLLQSAEPTQYYRDHIERHFERRAA